MTLLLAQTPAVSGAGGADRDPRGEGRDHGQRDAQRPPAAGRARARRSDRPRRDRGEGADDARVASPCSWAKRQACACRRSRRRSARRTCGSRGCAAATRSSSPTACRSTAPGGDSFSLLQVPPLDLGQVEIIKGAASALYGASALGGVINLVSRRPAEAEREILLNATSQAGHDVTSWLARPIGDNASWTLLGGYPRQRRRIWTTTGGSICRGSIGRGAAARPLRVRSRRRAVRHWRGHSQDARAAPNGAPSRPTARLSPDPRHRPGRRRRRRSLGVRTAGVRRARSLVAQRPGAHLRRHRGARRPPHRITARVP